MNEMTNEQLQQAISSTVSMVRSVSSSEALYQPLHEHALSLLKIQLSRAAATSSDVT